MAAASASSTLPTMSEGATFSPISAIRSAKSFLSSESMMDLMGVPRIFTPYLRFYHVQKKDWREVN